jgi:hypothetical protein
LPLHVPLSSALDDTSAFCPCRHADNDAHRAARALHARANIVLRRMQFRFFCRAGMLTTMHTAPRALYMRAFASCSVKYCDAGMLTTMHTAPRALYMRAFAQLFPGKPSGLNVRNIVANSPRFRALSDEIDRTLAEDYAAAAEYARSFEAVRMIHDHGAAWDKGAYAAEVRARIAIFSAVW